MIKPVPAFGPLASPCLIWYDVEKRGFPVKKEEEAMKGQWKGFAAGMLVMLLVVCMVGTVGATVGKRTIEAAYSNIQVTLDGKTVKLADANGNAVEPFTIEGTTYLPVRAVANALGLEVDWDAATNTVVLKSSATEQPQQPEPSENETPAGEKHLVQPGEAFTEGGYITLADVEILYDGKGFAVKNNSEDIIRITASIVGVKADGTYEVLQMPSFSGIDKAQYEKDMQENGWAIEHSTNLVRPGETLEASMDVSDFHAIDPSWPEADIDGDGYYDLVFAVHPQPDEETITTATDDPVSAVYKLKAE